MRSCHTKRWNVCLAAKSGHSKRRVCWLIEANTSEFGKGGIVPGI